MTATQQISSSSMQYDKLTKTLYDMNGTLHSIRNMLEMFFNSWKALQKNTNHVQVKSTGGSKRESISSSLNLIKRSKNYVTRLEPIFTPQPILIKPAAGDASYNVSVSSTIKEEPLDQPENDDFEVGASNQKTEKNDTVIMDPGAVTNIKEELVDEPCFSASLDEEPHTSSMDAAAKKRFASQGPSGNGRAKKSICPNFDGNLSQSMELEEEILGEPPPTLHRSYYQVDKNDETGHLVNTDSSMPVNFTITSEGGQQLVDTALTYEPDMKAASSTPAYDSDTAEYTYSARGNIQLLYKGHIYYRNKVGGSGQTWWRCKYYNAAKCPARCHTKDNRLVRLVGQHNHPFDELMGEQQAITCSFVPISAVGIDANVRRYQSP